jgi:hypothetical protein
MSDWKPSTRASQMLSRQRLAGLAYPTERNWERLYQMLVEEAEKRGRTPPPPPFTYSLDHEPTEADKVARLREQVAWADRNQLLHRVQMFFDALPSSGWNRTKR